MLLQMTLCQGDAYVWLLLPLACSGGTWARSGGEHIDRRLTDRQTDRWVEIDGQTCGKKDRQMDRLTA